MAMVTVAELSNPANEMETVLVAAPAAPSGPGHNMHKNCLQEFTQRSGIRLPAYSTINEGTPHSPKFRAIVLVDGMQMTSPNTFSHRKDAEQDIAKLALESLHVKFKNEGSHYIHKDPVFCKSILNEYGVKQKIDRPSYTTTQEQGLLPMFITTVTFDGKAYVGFAGKNKKEAEQNAACTVIDSILGLVVVLSYINLFAYGTAEKHVNIWSFEEVKSILDNFAVNSNTSSAMAQIIKSKGRLYAAVNKGVNTGHSALKNQAENNGSNYVIERTKSAAVGTTGSFLAGSASWVPYPSSCVEIAQSNQVNSQIYSSDFPMEAVISKVSIPKKRKKRTKKKQKDDQTKRARSDD